MPDVFGISGTVIVKKAGIMGNKNKRNKKRLNRIKINRGKSNKKKTNKSASKRFWLTATGKVKFKRAGGSHLMSSKSRARGRSLKRTIVLSKAESARLRGLLAS